MEQILRGALLGYGWIAQHGHAPFYRDATGAQVVAVADVCPARRRQAEQDLPGVRTYPDASSLLAAEAWRLDFVDIATPPSDHAALAIAALARGLHVLCEKPLATSSIEAAAMIEAARLHRRVLFPCHTYKHAPVIRTVRRLLTEGRIGRVHLVTLQTFRNTHARGTPEWRPNWRREQRIAGGGIAMDHGSHTFYLAMDWLDGLPRAVSARMTATAPHDTEDSFSCTMTLPGGIAVAYLTWNAGVRRVNYTLHGEHGAITVTDDDVELALMGPPRPGGNGAATWTYQRETVASDWMDASHVGWFASLFMEMRRAIDLGDWTSREAMQAWACVRLIESAYASARAGGAEQAVPDAGELLDVQDQPSSADDTVTAPVAQEEPCLTGAILSFS